MRVHKWRMIAGLVLLAAIAGGGVSYAQTQDQSKVPPAVDSLPPQTVTIFGNKRRTGDPTRTQLDNRSAESCGFMNGYDPVNDDVVQDYLQSFYGTDDNANQTPDTDQTDPNLPGNHFKDTAPFGDASQDNAANTNTLPGMQVGSGGVAYTPDQAGPCGPSDKAFAAGRNFIARRDASLKEAFAAFDARDYPKALDLFRKSYTKMGYDSAALMQGKMYLAGMGMKPDTKQAIFWLRKVTDARFGPNDVLRFNPDDPTYMNTRTDAAMTLAKIYTVGLGVPRDPQEARRWYMKADDFGYMPATHTVGQIYEYGYAGERSASRASAYYKKAATAGYAPSMYALGELYIAGGDGVAKDAKLGAEWLMAAAKRGHADALYAVGNMYDLGDVLRHEPQKAVVYYKEAALKGQPDAEDAIGLMLYTGEGVAKDLPAARKWFGLAARQGNGDAMFNLGAMLANGQGGEKNTWLAYVWLKLAQASGVEKAGPVAAMLEAKLAPDERAKAEAILKSPA